MLVPAEEAGYDRTTPVRAFPNMTPAALRRAGAQRKEKAQNRAARGGRTVLGQLKRPKHK